MEEISFGNWLRKQRRGLDLGQAAFADQVGCAEITLRRIEAGRLKPSKELAGVILEQLGISETERPQWISFARGLSGFPPQSMRSSDIPKSNLPAPLTTFIGRKDEQLDVIRLINKHRLVTLVGPGGIGKTRLSIKIGEQIIRDYADGVWLVELAPIYDPLLVPRTIAIAVGVRDEPQRPIIDMLSDYLRQKKILLILDNCEHLLDACARLADTLLRFCPDLKILVTSREALGIMGEAHYKVPSLALPDLQRLPENFKSYESIKLFEARAQLAQMDFSLTVENVGHVAEICTHLDGIPLAIELAAARVNTFSPEQIALRFQDLFNLLTVGNRAALPRHQTLKAAIDWSYNLLSPAEKSVFRRLSVFVNGWTLEAAEFVCSDISIAPEEIWRILAQLTNKSLIFREDLQIETRYRILETLRRYANEKLVESGESNNLRDKHLQYFLTMAETAKLHLLKPEQLQWLAKLDMDYENIRLALEWAQEDESSEPSLRLCAALGMFWFFRSFLMEGSKWLENALIKFSPKQSQIEKTARVQALCQDARLADALDDIDRMKRSAELSLSLAKEDGDSLNIAIARLYVGIAAKRCRENDYAFSLIQESLAEFRALTESYWEVFSLIELGLIEERRGNSRNENWYLQALELARKAGERYTLADILLQYSELFYSSYRFDEYKKYVEEADMLYKQIGSVLKPTTWALAIIAWLNGDYRAAKSCYMELLEIYDRIGERNLKSAITSALGLLELEHGNLGHAKACFETALAIAHEIGNQVFVARRFAELGSTFFLQGDLSKGRQNFYEAISLAKQLNILSKLYILLLMLKFVFTEKPIISSKILGAIHISHQQKRVSIEPFLQRYIDYADAQAHEQLSDVAFEAAFSEGHGMSLDDSLDLALKTVDEMAISNTSRG